MGKPNPGDRWKPTASQLNRFIDAANRQAPLFHSGPLATAPYNPCAVSGKAPVGVDFPLGSVVMLVAASIERGENENLFKVCRAVDLEVPAYPGGGCAETAYGRPPTFGVTLAPIAADRIGPVAVGGVAAAVVNWSAPTHEKWTAGGNCVVPVDGGYANFEAAFHGFRWLYREDDTGSAWAYVDLREFQQPRFNGYLLDAIDSVDDEVRVNVAPDDTIGDALWVKAKLAPAYGGVLAELGGSLTAGQFCTVERFETEGRWCITWVYGDTT